MEELRFVWDEQKNKTNIKKHGISFSEASTVFYDPSAIVFDDPDHSLEENRFLIIGYSVKEKLCIVSHCYRGEEEEWIRIIFARKATMRERQAYIDWNGGASDERRV